MAIVPVIVSIKNQDKCPECGKNENIKTVCAHCGHEYPEEDENISKIITVVLISLWVIFTLAFWLFDQDTFGSKRTLLEIILVQWEFVKNLKLW